MHKHKKVGKVRRTRDKREEGMVTTISKMRKTFQSVSSPFKKSTKHKLLLLKRIHWGEYRQAFVTQWISTFLSRALKMTKTVEWKVKIHEKNTGTLRHMEKRGKCDKSWSIKKTSRQRQKEMWIYSEKQFSRYEKWQMKEIKMARIRRKCVYIDCLKKGRKDGWVCYLKPGDMFERMEKNAKKILKKNFKTFYVKFFKTLKSFHLKIELKFF